MKNYFFILPAIFIFSFTLVAQTKPQTTDDLKAKIRAFKKSESERYKIRYDKITDKSSVIYMGDVLHHSLSFPMSGTSIQLLTEFQFDADVLDRSIDTFKLIFTAFGKQREFLKNRNLYILADAERFDFGVGEYDGDLGVGFASGFKTWEGLSFHVKREQLEKFAQAKTLEIKIGTRKFKSKEDIQRGFTNILALGSIE